MEKQTVKINRKMKYSHKNDQQIDFWAEKNWWLSFTKQKNAHGFHLCYTKKSFPLSIFSVNVTKSTENCVFAHICWKSLIENLGFCVVLTLYGTHYEMS